MLNSLSRRTWAMLQCASLFFFLAHRQSFAAPASQPGNVLLLISDDQGLDAGCYGSHDVHTPNIDRLAANGTRFTHAFAAVSSCSPSRATILTGMYNHANGQYGLQQGAHNQRTRPNVLSLPRILGTNGYRTGLIGKYHLATDDVYPFEVRTGASIDRDPVALGKHVHDFLTTSSSAPFFLVVGFGDTHRAGQAFGGLPLSPDAPAAQQTTVPSFLMDLPDVRRDYADYLASVNNLDRCVGAVLQQLDAANATSSTLVIFLSDNGIPFPGAKTNFYDPGINLPLIIDDPSTSPTIPTSDALVSWVDVAPTILEWIGIKFNARMQGASILPVLRGGAPRHPDRIFASHTFHEITMYYPMRCVRTRDYKLIWNLAHELSYPTAQDILRSPSWKAILAQAEPQVANRPLKQYLHRPEFELYDLRNDPSEVHNLAEDPQQQHRFEQLKSELLNMMRDTKDPWLPVASGIADSSSSGE